MGAVTRVAFGERLAAAWSRATGELLPLSLVPVLTGLLAVDELLRVLEFEGFHVGVRFAFPAMVVDAWTFVSAPTPDGVRVSLAPFVLLFPVVVGVHGLLGAGYLGSVHQATVDGSYRFLENVSRYGARLLAYAAAAYALALPLIYVTLVDPTAAVGLVLVAMPVGLVLSYLFFATPYLVVVADEPLLDALALSYELAAAGGAYFEYAAKYFLFVLLVSLAVTVVAVNLRLVGVFLALFGTAPLGLALNVATLEFVDDLVSEP